VTLATFCASGCTISTLYDQAGGSRNLIQATAANQPNLVANCIGTNWCLQINGSSYVSSSPTTFTPATGIASFSTIAMGNGQRGFPIKEGANQNRIQISYPAANQWSVANNMSGVVFTVPAADNVLHSGIAVIGGATTGVWDIDGAETICTAGAGCPVRLDNRRLHPSRRRPVSGAAPTPGGRWLH
jgi:hypothetical protein